MPDLARYIAILREGMKAGHVGKITQLIYDTTRSCTSLRVVCCTDKFTLRHSCPMACQCQHNYIKRSFAGNLGDTIKAVKGDLFPALRSPLNIISLT